MTRLIIFDDEPGKNKIMCLQTSDISLEGEEPKLYFDNKAIDLYTGEQKLSLTVYFDDTEFAEMIGIIKISKWYRIKRFFRKIVEKTRL